MTRAATIALAVILAWPVLARAESNAIPGPVCSQPNVLRLVQERLSRGGQLARLESDAVGQVSTRDDRVNCAVRVHTIFYNTPQLGGAAVDRVMVYRYALELRRNGIFLLQ